MDKYDDTDLSAAFDAIFYNLIAEQLGENATEEEINDALNQFKAEMDEKMYSPYRLDACLWLLTKDELQDIARVNKFRGFSKLHKDKLIEFLYNRLPEPTYLKTLYTYMTDLEVELLYGMGQTNLPLVSSDSLLFASDLMRYGLCFMDESAEHLILPDELKPVFGAIDENDDLEAQRRENALIHSVCFTAVYLYGAYPYEKLLQRLQEVGVAFASEAEFRNWYTHASIQREDYILQEHCLSHPMFLNEPDKLAALQQTQQSLSRSYWPGENQLEELNMEHWLVHEDLYEQLWAFESCLMRTASWRDLDEVGRLIEYSIRSGVTLQALLAFLSEQVFMFDSKRQIEAFVQLIQQIWNNTPMWANNGYTPLRLSRAAQQKSAAKGKKEKKNRHKKKKNRR